MMPVFGNLRSEFEEISNNRSSFGIYSIGG